MYCTLMTHGTPPYLHTAHHPADVQDTHHHTDELLQTVIGAEGELLMWSEQVVLHLGVLVYSCGKPAERGLTG